MKVVPPQCAEAAVMDQPDRFEFDYWDYVNWLLVTRQTRELRGYSLATRGRLVQMAWRRAWVSVAVFVIVVLCCAPEFYLGYYYYPWPSGFLFWGSVAIWIVAFIWLRRRLRTSLQICMREQGLRPARCFRCSRDLREYQGDRCPSCHVQLIDGDADQ